MGNLAIPPVTAAQNQKEVTINDGIDLLDRAITDKLDVDFTSGNVSLTNAQFRQHALFNAENVVSGRELTVPSIRRSFLVYNTSETANLLVVRGSTEIELGPETLSLFYTDGTANGLIVLAGGAGGGGGGSIDIEEDGDPVAQDIHTLNFTGDGVKEVTEDDGTVTVEIEFPEEVDPQGLGDLEDVLLDDETNGDILQFNGVNWENVALTQGAGYNLPFQGALLRRDSNQSITQSGTTVPIEWNQVEEDTDGFYNAGSPSRLTIPSGITRVRVTACLEYVAGNTPTNYAIEIIKNGSGAAGLPGKIGGLNGYTNNCNSIVSSVVPVTAGDFFELSVFHSTTTGVVRGASRTWLAIEVVERSGASAQPFDISGSAEGWPGSAGIVLQRYVATRAFTFPTDGGLSQGRADTEPTGDDLTFDLEKNGTKFGEMIFEDGENVAIFDVTETEFDPGDVLTVVGTGGAGTGAEDFVWNFAVFLS